jgi:Plant transposon protein
MGIFTKDIMVVSTSRFMKARAVRRAILRSEIKERIQTRLFMPRKYEGVIDYDCSTWGRMLVNDRIIDLLGDRKGGKLLRRRFRVPYPLFEQLVAITRESGWFSEKAICAGTFPAPVELKILAVLRVLGRGYCFDGVEELCLISAESLRIFFRKFVTLFSQENYAKYCNHPDTPEEIERAMGVFTKLGLPGCIGSADCVHIRWERCPAGSRSTHKGKEGFPTLSYEVTVDHTKKIIAATEGHPGARNDKTIVEFDGFLTKLHNGELYADVPFDIINNQGNIKREKGLYLIVDGGYHKWKCLQGPFKHTSTSAEALWSRWVESVR